MSRKQWPKWWAWDLELTPHLVKRMGDRTFTELEVREMCDNAYDFEKDVHPDRWLIKSKVGRIRWELVVEPDATEEILLVVTAYRPEID